MNGRSARIKQWLDSISNDLLQIYAIFDNDLITDNDIGEKQMSMIKGDFVHLLMIIDDVIFKLEN